MMPEERFDMRRASVMPGKDITTGSNPIPGMSRTLETKRLNSSCSKQDRENMISESQRNRTIKSKEKTHQDHIAP